MIPDKWVFLQASCPSCPVRLHGEAAGVAASGPGFRAVGGLGLRALVGFSLVLRASGFGAYQLEG